jgi:hypothetical protein
MCPFVTGESWLTIEKISSVEQSNAIQHALGIGVGSPRSPKIIMPMLDLGLASEQSVLRMNAQSPSRPTNVRITPNLASYSKNRRIIC